jgi:hypothetical protein
MATTVLGMHLGLVLVAHTLARLKYNYIMGCGGPMIMEIHLIVVN